MRWQSGVVDFPTVSDQDEVPFDIMTLRTPECVMLETEDRYSVTSLYLHQHNLSVASHTKHRTYSLKNIIVYGKRFRRKLAL
jgi:hypothetical protein